MKDMRNVDPYRLEGMDVYSNILYVKDEKGPLSFLAHQAVRTDKVGRNMRLSCGLGHNQHS